MKKVLIFGTFDGIHEGHRNLFLQAKEYGDYLSVIVARDETVLQIKGRLPKYTEAKRSKALSCEDVIDNVTLGCKVYKYRAIHLQKPDVICLGYDQKNFIDKLREMLDSNDLQETQVIRLQSYKPYIYKSSKINKSL